MSHYIQSSLSYVTGAHTLKVGFQQRFGWQQDTRTGINADLISSTQWRADPSHHLQHADQQPE